MRLFQIIHPRNALFFGVLALVLSALYFFIVQLPQNARKSLEDSLASLGFHHVKIGELKNSFSGIHARDIKLDEYGIDAIQSLDINVHWPLYIFGGGISAIKADGLHVTRTADDARLLVSGSFQKILDLPAYRFELSNAVIDVTTSFGDIRLTGDITATPLKDKKHDIKARLLANQYQMGFETSWQGTMDDAGHFDLYAEILDGRLNAGALAITRLSGWASLSNNTGAGLLSQISAVVGRANINGLPLQSLSLHGQKTMDSTDLVLRTGISGLPDILFSADTLNTPEKKLSTVSVKGDDLGRFLKTMEREQKTPRNVPDILADTKSFSLLAELQPDRGFAGGPAPYALSLSLDGGKQTQGNVLFYPETLEVRGSLELEENYLKALAAYFKIPKDNINKNFLRLDGRFASMLSQKESD